MSDNSGISHQLRRNRTNAASFRFAHRVFHRLFHALLDRGRDVEAPFAHRVERPDPDVVFLEASRLVNAQADRVMADFVKEDRSAHRPARVRRFDALPGPAIAIANLPRDAAGALAPLADVHVVSRFHFDHDRIVFLLHRLPCMTVVRRRIDLGDSRLVDAHYWLSRGWARAPPEQIPKRLGDPRSHADLNLSPARTPWPLQ